MRTQGRIKWTSHLYSNTEMLSCSNSKVCAISTSCPGVFRRHYNHETILRSASSFYIRARVITSLWKSNEEINIFKVAFLLEAWLEIVIKSTWLKRMTFEIPIIQATYRSKRECCWVSLNVLQYGNWVLIQQKALLSINRLGIK